MRTRALVALAAALTVLALSTVPASARTQTQGSDLGPAADGGFGCETAFRLGFAPPFTYEPFPTGMSTCTGYMPGTTIQNTHLVPGPGKVTNVRVKSGPNPAPLQISIIRRLFQTNPNNPNEITDAVCCTGVKESAVFRPTPNAVTSVAVNLPVSTQQSVNGASGWHDIVAVSGAGPGQLPLASVGPHTPEAGTIRSTPTPQLFYPKIQPGGSNNNNYDYPNYVVLMQYDWCDGGAASSRAKASQACGAITEPPKINRKGKPVASVSSKSLKLKKGKVAVKVACATATKARCKGKVGLYTRPKKGKAKLLASKSVNMADGKSAKVTLKLSRKARKRVPRKSNRVSVKLSLGKTLGTVKKNLTLKR